MRKTVSLTLIGTVLLSACSVIGTRAAAVSGQLWGFDPTQNLRLALVGFNSGQYVADGRRAQVIDRRVTGGYTFTLPRDVAPGLYRLVVFRDANNNAAYDSGDTILSRHNGKTLIYSLRNDAPYAGVTYGWNIRNDLTGAVQATILSDYDIEAERQR